jgi:hypothetical protein
VGYLDKPENKQVFDNPKVVEAIMLLEDYIYKTVQKPTITYREYKSLLKCKIKELGFNILLFSPCYYVQKMDSRGFPAEHHTFIDLEHSEFVIKIILFVNRDKIVADVDIANIEIKKREEVEK